MGEEKSISTTLREMGIRAKSKVLRHLFLDNAYEHNLLPNIANCNYLFGHQGRTSLEPLDGLPPFVDDIFVYGYVREKDLFSVGGKVLCSNATSIVAKVSTAARETYGRFLHPSMVHTVRGGGLVRSTIGWIETRIPAKNNWIDLYGEDPAAVFVCKVDTSELSIEEVQAGIVQFAKLLAAHAMGIYSVDYTQDFSGTLDREALVESLEHLGLVRQDDGGEREGTILENTHSVGEHVCTWVRNGKRTKIYNKIVSNFEAGEVQKPMGAKLAEYVDCPNEHLRKTFHHPEVQKRGCTRVEISVYGRDFSIEHTNAIAETLEPLQNIFVVQPPRQLWNNLARHLDRCMVCCCKETQEIFLAWYCHAKTGRVAGVRVRGNLEKWEESVRWTMAEFGFRRCPIFRVDVSSLDPIEIEPLRCYTKDGPTTLAESNKPTRVHSNAPRIEFFLPSTKYIEWQWRTKKMQNIGMEKSSIDILEVPSDREISFLSKRKRQQRLEDLQDAIEGDRWVEATKDFHRQMRRKKEEELERRRIEQKRIEEGMEAHRAMLEKLRKRSNMLYNAFDALRIHKAEKTPGEYRILGYLAPRDIHPTWKCRGFRIAIYAEKVRLLWATEELLRLVEGGSFSDGGRLHVAIPGEEILVHLRNARIEKAMVPTKSGAYEEYGKLCTSRYLLQEAGRRSCLLERPMPPPKERVQALDMEEGEYQCYSYARMQYRGKPRTILFLEDKCEECAAGGCWEGHAETAVWGHFLQEELQKIRLGPAPLYCRIGREKTTKSKNKDRVAYVSIPSLES